MKSNYLFPTVYKKIGWVLFVPFAIIGIIFLADSIHALFHKSLDQQLVA